MHQYNNLIKKFNLIKGLIPWKESREGTSYIKAIFEGRADLADIYELQSIVDNYSHIVDFFEARTKFETALRNHKMKPLALTQQQRDNIL